MRTKLYPITKQGIQHMTIFCAVCQADTEHEVATTPSGEIEVTCTCGHFIRFAEMPDQIRLDLHKTSNQRA